MRLSSATACLCIRYTYTVCSEEVVEMTNIVMLVAALLFAFGVLIGSVLHTQAVHREYRRIAERVRELHEIQEALADQNKVPVLAGSSDRSPGTYRE
jgi:biopolymer transport protein ExbB/TolQ